MDGRPAIVYIALWTVYHTVKIRQSLCVNVKDIRNTVGNIPMEWFKDYNHIGYDLLGRRILKPEAGDEIDEFIEKNDNPDYW